MSERIRRIYRRAKVTAPDGKGIHTERFHRMAVGIKKSNPSYPMSRCYQIAMGQLGKRKAVRPSHLRSAAERRRRIKKGGKDE